MALSSGSSRGIPRWTSLRSTSRGRAAGRTAGRAPRADRGVARPPLPMHWPGSPPTWGAACAGCRCTTGCARRRRVRTRRSVGDRPLVRAGSPGPCWRYSFERTTSWIAPVGEEVPRARGRRAVSTSRATRSSWCRDPPRLEDLQHLCTGGPRRPPGRVTYTLPATRARRDRDGSHGDPPGRSLLVVARRSPAAHEGLLRRGLFRRRDGHRRDERLGDAARGGSRSRELLTAPHDATVERRVPLPCGARDRRWVARAWALRVSYTGELGWELYVPTVRERLYDKLLAAGADSDCVTPAASRSTPFGSSGGFRGWDMTGRRSDDPFSSGLGFAWRAGQGHVGAAPHPAPRRARTRRLVSVR